MKKINTQGFGVLEVIAIVLIVAILGLVGYRTYETYMNSSATKSDTEKQPASSSSLELKTFKSKYTDVNFSYPSDWKTEYDYNKELENETLTISVPDEDDVKVTWMSNPSGFGGACADELKEEEKIYVRNIEQVEGDLYIIETGSKDETTSVGLASSTYVDSEDGKTKYTIFFDENGKPLEGALDTCLAYYGFSGEDGKNNSFLGTDVSAHSPSYDGDDIDEDDLKQIKDILKSVELK